MEYKANEFEIGPRRGYEIIEFFLNVDTWEYEPVDYVRENEVWEYEPSDYERDLTEIYQYEPVDYVRENEVWEYEPADYDYIEMSYEYDQEFLDDSISLNTLSYEYEQEVQFYSSSSSSSTTGEPLMMLFDHEQVVNFDIDPDVLDGEEPGGSSSSSSSSMMISSSSSSSASYASSSSSSSSGEQTPYIGITHSPNTGLGIDRCSDYVTLEASGITGDYPTALINGIYQLDYNSVGGDSWEFIDDETSMYRWFNIYANYTMWNLHIDIYDEDYNNGDGIGVLRHYRTWGADQNSCPRRNWWIATEIDNVPVFLSSYTVSVSGVTGGTLCTHLNDTSIQVANSNLAGPFRWEGQKYIDGFYTKYAVLSIQGSSIGEVDGPPIWSLTILVQLESTVESAVVFHAPYVEGSGPPSSGWVLSEYSYISCSGTPVASVV